MQARARGLLLLLLRLPGPALLLAHAARAVPEGRGAAQAAAHAAAAQGRPHGLVLGRLLLVGRGLMRAWEVWRGLAGAGQVRGQAPCRRGLGCEACPASRKRAGLVGGGQGVDVQLEPGQGA